MRILTFGRSTSTRRRGSTKRRILTAAAILQIAGGLMNPSSAQAQPSRDEVSQMRNPSKKSALEILKAMTPDKTILRSGQQAWIPGGYLGMSKSWG